MTGWEVLRDKNNWVSKMIIRSEVKRRIERVVRYSTI